MNFSSFYRQKNFFQFVNIENYFKNKFNLKMTESDVKINSLETLDEFIKSKDNSISTVYFSDIPEICKTEKCMIGGEKID